MTTWSNQLEIVLFTYNRAPGLERTLAALHASPFGDCRITVLDNASTDRTPEVCASWAARFGRLRTVRHAHNIGLGGNFLRGVEISRAVYTWLLSDDEVLDFGDCTDVLEAIGEGDVDLISMGSPSQKEWERGLRTTTQDLVRRGSRHFSIFTFAAGTIFRTDQFDSHCMSFGYRNLHNLYPQFEHVYQSLVEDRSVLVSGHEIVRRLPAYLHETVGSELFWFTCWSRSAERIEDRALRRRAIYDGADGRVQFAWHLALGIALETAENRERVRWMLMELVRGFVGEQRLLLAALAPITLVPSGLLRALYRLLRRSAPPQDATVRFDPLRL